MNYWKKIVRGQLFNPLTRFCGLEIFRQRTDDKQIKRFIDEQGNSRMAQALHRITPEELPTLVDWLAKYLPHSTHIYGTASIQQRGKWAGHTYYTLGWPDIKAVAEGPIDKAACPCPNYLTFVTSTCVFSPRADHLEQLLISPGLYDWSQPLDFEGVSSENGEVIEKMSKAKGAKVSKVWKIMLLRAGPGDITLGPVPKGYEVRPLDPDLHTDYIVSTWPHVSDYADEFVHALLTHLPSYGLFDREGNPVAVALTYQTGYVGMLHVREETRGRGLGKYLSSLMAEKVIQEYCEAVTASLVDNEPSINLHLKIGYKPYCHGISFLHSMEDKTYFASQ